jgi:ubiquinone/menaquinone biosynthesis C-methylase UbiE
MGYLSQNQINQWQSLPKNVIQGKRKITYPWVHIGNNITLWKQFWDKEYIGNKTDKIMDFGCGAGWGWLIGSAHGFSNIVSFDINETLLRSRFEKFINILNTPVVYWEGIEIPFKDNEFDSIIAKASILKCVKTTFDVLIKELCRVSKPSGTWYIAPEKQFRKFRARLDQENLKNLIENKNIIVKLWVV